MRLAVFVAFAAYGIASVMGFSPSGSVALRLRGPAIGQGARCARQPSLALHMSADRKAEIEEVLKELEEFREKIVEQSKSLAKKVKAKPKDLKKALEEHPDIITIDQATEQLKAELETL
jgi:hypothetical protein